MKAKNVTTRKKVANIKPLTGQTILDSYFGKSRTLPVGYQPVNDYERNYEEIVLFLRANYLSFNQDREGGSCPKIQHFFF